MIPIVTSCDESYLPGLKALHNSYLRNSQDGFSFHALLTGTQELADHVQNDLGINAILNPKFPADNYPTSKVYPVPIPVMWTSLLTPDLFPGEKSIHIDTDSLILQNLQPLVDMDQRGKVMAATRCNSDRKSNYSPTGQECDGFGPMTSLMIFNHGPWHEKRMLERVVEAMQRTDYTWHMIGQGVLHYVVQGDWLELPWNNQAHAGHDTYFTAPKKEVFTLHFMGTNPWCEFSNPAFITERKLETRKLWNTYAG